MQTGSLLNTVAHMALGVLFVLILFKSGLLGRIYDITVGPEGLQFRFLSSFVISVTKYENLDEVVETSSGGLHYLMAYNLKNRSGVPCFLIRKKQGWFARTILITPHDPKAFLDAVTNAGVPVRSGRGS